MLRILITGSRDWYDMDRIARVLKEYVGCCDVTLVSGNASTGADFYAEAFAVEAGWELELHPADWWTFGKKAGFMRNTSMIKQGADVCLAFIRNNSKGATMTARLAREAGIEVRQFIWDDF